MRGATVYYLKILLAICTVHEMAGGLIRNTTDAAYKKYLSLKSLPFEDCASSSSLYRVNYLDIESCSTLPCSMKRNAIIKVTVLFDDNGNGVTFLKHEVRWVFNYIKTQAAISPDPCDGDHDCIMSASDGKTYWANIFVNETLPVMRGSMLWESKDECNQNLICFEVPVLITV
ncbi:NPC intracellular cholesterol transporter 2 isoform X1 [Drosophila miranda]|uniref:NPC intracellular cholesterol transporter 2 isoform X1 n=1 Tax=Drosophila pseudoobscura pseudoobscura TaxID=46245 RepID=A0A6I8VN89_DROPS|nr:NPC intracellular cholesterol transporter 2 isoform X1 [Drosophila miranda]XP_033232487.1 NPC intracellular cholesterol transporter 2 isoform X1 [Drosophila pseudoobscura]